MLRRAPLRQTASEPHASRSSPMAAEWLVALTSRGLGHWTTQQHRRITHTHTNFSFSLSLSVFTIAACIATDRGRFFFFLGGGGLEPLGASIIHPATTFSFAASNLFPIPPGPSIFDLVRKSERVGEACIIGEIFCFLLSFEKPVFFFGGGRH